ncbi:hypothetical protein NX794_18975 [Streptomyces sp. LP11]|uniref:Uncharacterized protein n=1 Tax=Streptomyces pyxinicus TaxID=2970331 RepID=A0ABT2B434_9ACTN|nr:hypothetical protein [Streptomyces sp. LP11]MCS0603280.1 hypothetical protein [Streptomyces sp. LP11]
MNPYTSPPPRPPDTRPLRRRKRVWAAAVALFAAGAIGGTQSAEDQASAAPAPRPAVTTTVTATATATATETASPEPAPTVTKTRTVKKPGPTVTVTKAASGTVRSSGTGTGSATGTCSIVSSSGNCYRAGQFCRNSDHGSLTTTASGARIRCSYSASAWRWSYA